MPQRIVAIFVDAGFFTRIFTQSADPNMTAEPEKLAKAMWHYWIKHVDRRNGEALYRIFFYDCPPLSHKVHHPITNKLIDFSKSDITIYKNKIHEALLRQPFVACRMGHLNSSDNEWDLSGKILRIVSKSWLEAMSIQKISTQTTFLCAQGKKVST